MSWLPEDLKKKKGSLTFLVEAFPAELADERLVARVDADVRVERGASVERLAAVVALVRLLLQSRGTFLFVCLF